MLSFAEYCDIIACHDRESWLAERRKRIQASEVAGVLGVSSWSSATSIYADKINPPLVDESNERFSIGAELEAPIRELYRKKFGGKVTAWQPFALAVSKQHPWLGATPDALAEDSERDGLGLLEIKTASEFSKHEWENDVPLPYNVQVQMGLAVTGLRWGVVAVLIGVSRVERIFIERNDDFIERAIGVLRDFAVCLELRQPPPVDASEQTAKALFKLHPQDSGESIQLPEGSDDWLARMRRYKSLCKRLEERIGLMENQFKAAIGDNTYGVTPAGEWLSWKSSDRKGFTVEPTTIRTLRQCKPPKLIEYAGDEPVAIEPNGVDYKVANRKQLPLSLKLRLLREHGRCRWCGCQLTLHSASFEHVHPLGVGGTNDFHNIDLACATCNQKRGDEAHALESTRY